MSNEFEKEALTEEEIKRLDEALKDNENIELPASLSAEGIEKMLLADNSEQAAAITPMPKKKSYKKQITAFVSAAAVFVVAVVGAFALKPWQKNSAPPIQSAATNENGINDYAQIEQMFKDYSAKYKEQQNSFRYTVDDFFDGFGAKNESAIVIEDSVATGSASSATGSTDSEYVEYKSSYGKTNEQVQGVSEADIIKNDGKYLYSVASQNADWDKYYNELDSYVMYLNGNEETTSGGQSTPGYNPQAKESSTEGTAEYKVQTVPPVLIYSCGITIVEPLQDGSFNHISTVNITEEDKDIYFMSIKELYVSGNRLIALVECSVIDNLTTEDYRKFYYGSINENVITMAVCFDISDRSSPVETWRTYQDGSYISSRLIGEQLVIMSTYGVDITDDEAVVVESCVPMYGTDMDSYKRVPCDCICVMEEIYDTRYLVASTLDIKDVNTLKTQAVLGAGEDVYCTTETLYAVSTRYESASDMAEVFSYSTEAKTYIYKFDIRGGDINYLGNGVVKGSTLNQFSMDEHNGYLRIATTMGNWGDSLENQVYVLDSSLQVVGEITGIAKGETIKSVRFTGDTGYVVTFEQTDPLFVIDLSNPASPVIRGELKIPGFSAYLHPVGDGLLLGVGADGDENGQNGGIKVSLFDVSDPQNPVECDKITVSAPQGENRYTYLQSEAYYTHKAMCWDAENAIMYVPYAEMIDIYTTTGYEGVHYGNILAVKVDVVNKKLSDDGSCKVLTSDTESYGSFVRATYIDNVVFGYVQDVNTFYSFNKATQEYLNKIKLG